MNGLAEVNVARRGGAVNRTRVANDGKAIIVEDNMAEDAATGHRDPAHSYRITHVCVTRRAGDPCPTIERHNLADFEDFIDVAIQTEERRYKAAAAGTKIRHLDNISLLRIVIGDILRRDVCPVKQGPGQSVDYFTTVESPRICRSNSGIG